MKISSDLHRSHGMSDQRLEGQVARLPPPPRGDATVYIGKIVMKLLVRKPVRGDPAYQCNFDGSILRSIESKARSHDVTHVKSPASRFLAMMEVRSRRALSVDLHFQ